jgi:hypothetical protein
MFEVKLDGIDQLLRKFDSFGKQIEELHKTVPEELVAWQRDDMRRKFPTVDVDASETETAASTEIFPRSRIDEGHHPSGGGPKQHAIGRAAPRQHRINRAPPQQHRGPLPRSNRPILREELARKLHDRMLKLASEAMKWP